MTKMILLISCLTAAISPDRHDTVVGNAKKSKFFRKNGCCITPLITPSNIRDHVDPMALKIIAYCSASVNISDLNQQRGVNINGIIQSNDSTEVTYLFYIHFRGPQDTSKVCVVLIKHNVLRKIGCTVPFGKRDHTVWDIAMLWSFQARDFQYAIKESCFDKFRIEPIIHNYLSHA